MEKNPEFKRLQKRQKRVKRRRMFGYSPAVHDTGHETVYGEGIITLSRFSNVFKEVSKDWIIVGYKQYVKLTLQYVSSDTEVSFFGDGSFWLSAESKHSTFISPSGFASVILNKIVRPKTRFIFQLKYEKVDYPGCGVGGLKMVECTAPTAFIASMFYPSLFIRKYNKIIRIIGKPNQYIEVHFIDMDLTDDDHVELFDVDPSTGSQNKLIWSYDKDTRPLQDVESSWHIIEINSQTGGKLKGRGFLGRYEIIDIQSFENKLSTCACPSGQFNFQRSCYSVEVVKGLISQQYAEERCKSYGGHLASIGSEQEMKFIFSMCAKKSPGVVYGGSVLIGLLKVTDNSCYQWIDGQPLVYTAWFPGYLMYPPQPDGGYDEKCTALVFTNGRNLHNWHDVPCNNYTGVFVCEMQSDNKGSPLNPWNITEASPNVPIDRERLFRCGTNEIVSKQAVCDAFPNCLDNSDEMHCVKDENTCTDLHFQCDDGICIPWAYYCDHVRQCKDGSDERACFKDENTCTDLHFQCDDGICIPWAYYCDHVRQCKDGSDERACSWPDCLTSEWKCRNNQCIPKHQRCDLAKHCFDGSDEANCEFCLTKPCAKEIEYDKQSCEDWWISGARWNGTYVLYIPQVAIKVTCEFKLTSSCVVIITYFDKSTPSVPYELAYTVKNQTALRKNCSQTVEITCYNKTIDGNDDVILSICKNRDCKCQSVKWEDIVILPVTDSITVYDPTIIPILETDLPNYNVSNDKAGFVYITLSHVSCTTELPVTSNQNEMYKTDNNRRTVERCIYDFESNQCTDMSHMQNCGEFVCPFGYFKCPESFCLPLELVCDGTNHCPNGNDETHCDTMRCPGLFRCRESKICLTIEKVCDGIIHCPMADDELGCNMTCPEVCRCNGSVIDCQLTNISDIFGTLNTNVRKLDVSYSHFRENEFSVPDMPYVAELLCHECTIEYLTSFSFNKLTNLIYLDLSYNRIKLVTNRTFTSLAKLRHLNLAGNLLKTLEDFSFVGLESLQYLNVSSNQIHTLGNKAFDGLGSLIHINIMHNAIQMFSDGIFSPLKKLKGLSSDLFQFCCPAIKPKTVTKENCCPKQQDEFSSCKDLIRNNTLRTIIWIVGILSFFGNLGVIIYRLNRQRLEPLKAHGLYVLNLSISDMLMGIYLLLIAVAGVYYKGDYVSNDITWRTSHYCKLAGVLSMMSSEASVTFILFLTVDCFLKVRYPFKTKHHITKHRAIATSVVSWIIVAVLAILPNFYKPYFADLFYSQTSVCFALPFSKEKTEGWEYSVALFVVYNSIAFLVMAFMQISIYNAGKSVMKTNSKQDFVLARRITLILVTDFLCWVPIGILGIISLHGHVFSSDVYAWVAVGMLPINSALNPFLYTFAEFLNQDSNKIKEKTEAVVYQYTTRNRGKNCRIFDWTMVSSVFTKGQKLSLKINSLKNVMKWKKFKPEEVYTVMLNIVERVAELHENGYTVVESIKPETIIVYLNNKTVVQAEIDSMIMKLVRKSDSGKSIEDIGLLARTMLE